eukprot:TRINITY_DN39905_c0_g1_i3.p1 TRINITY_DN39905_c0_g1~~TRINITY_DN39905_c0_g1_i3.p1  ORF type:complete len:226 (-),score=35.35 TRINITY_DN39905_c0_g1_i3:114-791(-)
MRKDAMVVAVEERIAAFTGLPAHGEESPLQLALDIAQPGGPGAGVPNIHHDKNHGLVRHVTSLTYLTSPEDGGETIFPVLPSPSSSRKPRRRSEELEKHAEKLAGIVRKQITDNKALSADGDWPPVQVRDGSDLHTSLTELCPAEGRKRGVKRADDFVAPLAVRPVPGRSIFFWQEVVGGGDPLLDVFHAGCPVREGEKLALQKFKNFAPGTPGCKASVLCDKYF